MPAFCGPTPAISVHLSGRGCIWPVQYKRKTCKKLKKCVQTLKIESGRCEMFRTPAFSVLQYLKVPVVQNKV